MSFRLIMILWLVAMVTVYVCSLALAMQYCSPEHDRYSLSPFDPFVLGILLPMTAAIEGSMFWSLSLVLIGAYNLTMRRNVLAMSRRSLLLPPVLGVIGTGLLLLFGHPQYGGCRAI